jgi:hypothetical protein
MDALTAEMEDLEEEMQESVGAAIKGRAAAKVGPGAPAGGGDRGSTTGAMVALAVRRDRAGHASLRNRYG